MTQIRRKIVHDRYLNIGSRKSNGILPKNRKKHQKLKVMNSQNEFIKVSIA